MTSAEFLSKYRVLKTLTEHGARTQIAQEVALGRMVMIHHLDVGTSAERQRLAAKVGKLAGDASTKIFDVLTIDGVQVVVTHFLATFTDLPSWLEEHSATADPSEAKTVLMQAPEFPTPAAPTPAAQTRATPPPAAGGFTSVFGASSAPGVPVASPPATPSAAPSPEPPAAKGGFTEVFGGVKPPVPTTTPRATKQVPKKPAGSRRATPATPAAPPPAAPATPPAASLAPPLASLAPPPASFTPAAPASPSPAGLMPEPKSPVESGFTRVFGAKPPQSANPTPPVFLPPPGAPSTGPSGPPMSPNAARFDSVMPPVERVPPPRPAPAPPPPPSINSTSNEFNALFARLDPSAASAPAAPPPIAPPAPSFNPASSAAPGLGGANPPMPSWQPPPAPPTPPSSLAGLAPGSPPAARGPSEFTRILGRAQQPPAAPPAARLPDPGSSAPGFPTPAVPQPQTQPPPAAKSTKSYLPVIIALNVVLIGAILVVVFVVMRR